MKLYYTPGACSLAAHIVLREANAVFDLEEVNLATKKTAKGQEFTAINPKGYVPALELDDGQVLTEDQVLLQYIADAHPEARLAPPIGTQERYRLMEWLAFIATEVHKGFGPLWNPAIPEATRENAVTNLHRRLKLLDDALGSGSWIFGQAYTIADAYLYTVLRWTAIHNVDISAYRNLTAYLNKVAERPAVKQALKAEGLKA
jgi:glutathione S-transferase